MILCENHISMTLQTGFNRLAVFLPLLFLTFLPGSLVAEEASTSDSWEFEAAAYLWGAGIGGESASGGSIDIDFDTIMDDLNAAAMAMVAARKNKWLLMTDIIYLDLSDGGNTSSGADYVAADVDLKAWIVTPTVGYRAIDHEKFNMDIIGGLRYLYLDASVDATIIDPSTPPIPLNVSDSGDNWDGIVGVRGDINLTDSWYILYHLDIGGGTSNSTWQGLAGIGYRFNKFEIVGFYRYLDWDFDDNEVFDDLNVSGPMLGFKYVF